MAVAKVFRTDRSQAIRLPKVFRVEADTVHLKRTSEGFLVITKDNNHISTLVPVATDGSDSWHNLPGVTRGDPPSNRPRKRVLDNCLAAVDRT
jgi:virulence-associated protein VagC